MQACFNYLLLLDLLELIGQLQLELLEAVSEKELVIQEKMSERRESRRRSSLIFMRLAQ